MHQFSGPDFSTLENTYTPTNVTFGTSSYPFYVYGNKAFLLAGANVLAADFIANIALPTISTASYNAAASLESSDARNGTNQFGSIGIGKYIVILSTASYGNAKGIIFDMSLENIVGYVSSGVNANNDSYKTPTFLYPIGDNKLICHMLDTAAYSRSALTSYILPTPMTKTSANGMTATYELEVYW